MSVPQQVVLTRAAVEVLIKQLSGVARLIAQLLCRGGLCVNECLRQRVRDVDSGQKMLIFRDVKGELGVCSGNLIWKSTSAYCVLRLGPIPGLTLDLVAVEYQEEYQLGS